MPSIAYRCPAFRAQLLIHVEDEEMRAPVHRTCLLCGARHVIDPASGVVLRDEATEEKRFRSNGD